MSKPENFTRRVFKSSNSFNPSTAWNISGGKVMAADSAKMEGFCFAMTCYWLRLAMQHGIDGSSRVLDGKSLLHISIVQSGYLSLSRTYTGAKNRAQEEKIVFEQAGLKVRQQYDIMQWATKVKLGEAKLRYFELGLKEHSVGLITDPVSDKIHYFDPNYGLFEYSHRGEALGDIVTHMEETYGIKDDSVVTGVGLR